MSLYGKGTVHLNRKYLPQFIKYLRKDMRKLPTESYQITVNNEYNICLCIVGTNKNLYMYCQQLIQLLLKELVESRVVIKSSSNASALSTIIKKTCRLLISLINSCHFFNISRSTYIHQIQQKITMVLMDFVFVNSYLHRKLFVDSIISVNDKRKKKIKWKK